MFSQCRTFQGKGLHAFTKYNATAKSYPKNIIITFLCTALSSTNEQFQSHNFLPKWLILKLWSVSQA
uniref:Uncharacterized protein n=1 Tax=Rhizophora mucronata TaxID=61149 RepID=A0A2P2QM47_RHIMU